MVPPHWVGTQVFTISIYLTAGVRIDSSQIKRDTSGCFWILIRTERSWEPVFFKPCHGLFGQMGWKLWRVRDLGGHKWKTNGNALKYYIGGRIFRRLVVAFNKSYRQERWLKVRLYYNTNTETHTFSMEFLSDLNGADGSSRKRPTSQRPISNLVSPD